MREPIYGWAGLAAATVCLGMISYIATCGVARAAEHEIRWINADPDRAAGALRVCQLERCVDVPADCGPGDTCSTVVDLEPGVWVTTAYAAEDGAGPWSPSSNALSIRVQMAPADCLELDVCRFDADGDGLVGGSDFNRFVQAFGGAWP
jgi:hypothetical protein